MKKPTKDLDFINEEGDPLKSDVQKGKPLLIDSFQNPKGSVGQKVRAGKMGEAKQIIAQRIGQSWGAKKPNLPEIKKMIDMFKEDGFAFSEEGQKVLKEMQKRFDKACKGKMSKATLGGPEEPQLFKNHEDLAQSLAKWEPSLKKKDSGWRQVKGSSKNVKWQHPEHGSVIQRNGEFHAVHPGKEYISSTHGTLAEAKQALVSPKPQK